jgi:hypothetical protein
VRKITYTLDVSIYVPDHVGDDPQELTDWAADNAAYITQSLHNHSGPFVVYFEGDPEEWVVKDEDGEIIVEHS